MKPDAVGELLPMAVGWYGKLAARGDFVGRGLPRSWLRVWDDWLQRAMANASRQIDAALLRERLLAMSPWQCIVLPVAQGQPAWSGVVIASTDRVGRVFPLMLAEAYVLGDVDRVGLSDLRERAARIAHWLREAATALSPRDFELGAAQWGADAWPAVSASDGQETVATLCRRRPSAHSFWWRLDASDHDAEVFDQPWPPHESLLLEWLAVTD